VTSLYFNELDPFAADWLGELFPDASIDRRRCSMSPRELIRKIIQRAQLDARPGVPFAARLEDAGEALLTVEDVGARLIGADALTGFARAAFVRGDEEARRLAASLGPLDEALRGSLRGIPVLFDRALPPDVVELRTPQGAVLGRAGLFDEAAA